MRVLVCGGRNFMDRDWLFKKLGALHASRGVKLIISGCAPGADTLGIEWAESREIEVAPGRSHSQPTNDR